MQWSGNSWVNNVSMAFYATNESLKRRNNYLFFMCLPLFNWAHAKLLGWRPHDFIVASLLFMEAYNKNNNDKKYLTQSTITDHAISDNSYEVFLLNKGLVEKEMTCRHVRGDYLWQTKRQMISRRWQTAIPVSHNNATFLWINVCLKSPLGSLINAFLMKECFFDSSIDLDILC